MKKEMIYIFMLIPLFIFSSCAKHQEEDINAVLQQGDFFETKGDYLQALHEYKKLEKLTDTKLFETLKVKNELARRGWGIDDLETSYTLKMITTLQNKVNEYMVKEGTIPDLSDPEFACQDAWGQAILLEERLKARHKSSYDYWLISFGKDGIRDTGDDVMIVNKGIIRQRMKKEKEVKKTSGTSSSVKRKKKKKRKPFEQTMDLKKMLEEKKREKLKQS